MRPLGQRQSPFEQVIPAGQQEPLPHLESTQTVSTHMPQLLDVFSMQSIPAFAPVQSPIAPQWRVSV